MVESVLNGRPSEGPKSILTSCCALALDKGGGAVRPVAIGEALRRIAARVVCIQDNHMVAETLKKVQQFGVAVKGGIEYAYASVRIHMLASLQDPTCAAGVPPPPALRLHYVGTSLSNARTGGGFSDVGSL